MEKGTSLPSTQLEVMQVVWDKSGAIMFGELSEELEDEGGEWEPNTVLTLLSQLAEQGMITTCKRGRLNGYTAWVAKEEYQQKQVYILVEQVFGRGTRHLTSASIKQDCLTKGDYDELKASQKEEGERT